MGLEEGNRILADKGWLEYQDGGFESLSPYSWKHLPVHLAAMKRWDDMATLLGDTDYFQYAYWRSFDDVCAWWVLVERNSPHTVVNAYVPELGGKSANGTAELSKGWLLMHFGHNKEALTLFKFVQSLARERGDQELLSRSIGNQALIHKAWGELDRAMELHKEQERLCKELGTKDGLRACLGNQALIHQAWGELDRAMELHKEKERLCKELGNKDGLQRSLGNQALIHRAWGELDLAMELHKEQERLCKELGNKDGLSGCLGSQALIHRAWGELDRAMELLKEQERQCKELGNKDGLSRSLALQAVLMVSKLDKPREALALIEEALDIAEKQGFKYLVSKVSEIRDQIREIIQSGSAKPGTDDSVKERVLDIPAAHDTADHRKVSMLNIQYQQELARWRKLPWWKRLLMKKPDRPTGK
ncbi:MAG: hypothetical protein FJY85_00085 [Deltaproteobacteria bacterium]|nr:hypothetical protein [Deltaproteobacteria bacterium]